MEKFNQTNVATSNFMTVKKYGSIKECYFLNEFGSIIGGDVDSIPNKYGNALKIFLSKYLNEVLDHNKWQTGLYIDQFTYQVFKTKEDIANEDAYEMGWREVEGYDKPNVLFTFYENNYCLRAIIGGKLYSAEWEVED